MRHNEAQTKAAALAYLKARADQTLGPQAARHIHLVPAAAALLPPEDPEAVPNADDLAEDQHEAALARLSEDMSRYARYPWPDVDRLVGAMGPADMWFILGRTGGGKSLFLQNTFDDLVDQQAIRVLYIGTEQSPEVLKIKHACLRAGVYPKLVLKPTEQQSADGTHQRALEAIAPELEWVRGASAEKYACYATSKYINRHEINRWTRGAVKQYGTQLVIVDHIDEVDHGEGRNPRHENTQTLNLIHSLGRELHIPWLIASQSKRLADGGQKFAPPGLEDLAENSNKERKATGVLGIWRPLKRGVTNEELKAVRLGQGDEHALYEPNEMGVKVLKTREDTGELGKQCRLRVERGRLLHIPEKDRYVTGYSVPGPRP